VNLMQLTVDNANAVYCGEDNIIYIKDKKKLIAAAGALKGHIVVPDTVTEIEINSFSGCTGLTDIIIPDSVTKIGDSAFSGVSSDAHFTVTNKLMKKKLLNSGSNIRDEQITVDVNL